MKGLIRGLILGVIGGVIKGLKERVKTGVKALARGEWLITSSDLLERVRRL